VLQVGFVETTEQRQRQEAVCDRAAVRRRFRAFDIDMDPLKVAGRLSELVDGCWSTVTQSVTQTSLPTAVRTSLGFSKRMAFSIYRLLGGFVLIEAASLGHKQAFRAGTAVSALPQEGTFAVQNDMSIRDAGQQQRAAG